MNDKVAPLLKPRSDLGIRTLSSVAMMSVAIIAIWLGGYVFIGLVIAVGLCVFFEFTKLVLGFAHSPQARIFWLLGGLTYVGLACFTLILFSAPFFGMTPAILLIAGVIGTDIGAYFAGRSIGGAKISPRISPSKTWSGLFGGIIGAGLMMVVIQAGIYAFRGGNAGDGDAYLAYGWAGLMLTGAALALVAQMGDFFESWMKRRAGVKDSGRLIPGHGGLFDRTDGLIAVAFAAGVITLFQNVAGC
ncbi:phosphatidate cytidylyltransferase [Sphingorhabdus sp. EL138]|uniref:phosphatidate cytidylyltransferase n=1 Tax=Sphingorhabdus sp. EL138 TaxID=2073156 RepID=UPI0025FB561D|nr:phosphatidate cytidylyltransferase [Sphingorhabdus sp. EL138]